MDAEKYIIDSVKLYESLEHKQYPIWTVWNDLVMVVEKPNDEMQDILDSIRRIGYKLGEPIISDMANFYEDLWLMFDGYTRNDVTHLIEKLVGEKWAGAFINCNTFSLPMFE